MSVLRRALKAAGTADGIEAAQIGLAVARQTGSEILDKLNKYKKSARDAKQALEKTKLKAEWEEENKRLAAEAQRAEKQLRDFLASFVGADVASDLLELSNDLLDLMEKREASKRKLRGELQVADLSTRRLATHKRSSEFVEHAEKVRHQLHQLQQRLALDLLKMRSEEEQLSVEQRSITKELASLMPAQASITANLLSAVPSAGDLALQPLQQATSGKLVRRMSAPARGVPRSRSAVSAPLSEYEELLPPQAIASDATTADEDFVVHECVLPIGAPVAGDVFLTSVAPPPSSAPSGTQWEQAVFDKFQRQLVDLQDTYRNGVLELREQYGDALAAVESRGGWTESNHQHFLKLYKQFKRKTNSRDSVLTAGAREMTGRVSRDELAKHYDWYEKLVFFRSKQNALIKGFDKEKGELLNACKEAIESAATEMAKEDERLRKLLSEAITQHTKLARLALEGQDCDRPMLGWRLLAKERSIDLPPLFKEPVFARTCTWKLSTSQLSSPCFAVAFAAVVEDGYGIWYGLQDEQIRMTVTAGPKAAVEVSVLSRNIVLALREMFVLVSAADAQPLPRL
eukprot:TRINITY_DN4930_c0_g1_i11.p1 TRINITY_DN4930_c0_g1~~TRINITY_DN4930_c0_g1_i11.p1  ORF type:complete len:573 (+),score=131.52 TRINITY_DN4930_c0_g1_i11:494-2212(+)